MSRVFILRSEKSLRQCSAARRDSVIHERMSVKLFVVWSLAVADKPPHVSRHTLVLWRTNFINHWSKARATRELKGRLRENR